MESGSGNKEPAAAATSSSTTTRVTSTGTGGTVTTTDNIENRQVQQKWSISFQEGRAQLRLEPIESNVQTDPKTTPNKQPGPKFIHIAPARATIMAAPPATAPSASYLYLSSLKRTFIAGTSRPQLCLTYESPAEQLAKLKAVQNLQTTGPRKRQGIISPKSKPVVVKKVYESAAALAVKRKREQQAVAKGTPPKPKQPKRSSIKIVEPNTNGGLPRSLPQSTSHEQLVTINDVQNLTFDDIIKTIIDPSSVEEPKSRLEGELIEGPLDEEEKLILSLILGSNFENEDEVSEPDDDTVYQSPPVFKCMNDGGDAYGLEKDLVLEYSTGEHRDNIIQQSHDPSTIVCCKCQINNNPFLRTRPVCTCSCLECEWQKSISLE